MKKIEKKVAFKVAYLDDRHNNLLGRLLTIIDASAPNPERGKAIKDLIKKEVYDDLKQYYNMSYDFPKQGLSPSKEDRCFIEYEEEEVGIGIYTGKKAKKN